MSRTVLADALARIPAVRDGQAGGAAGGGEELLATPLLDLCRTVLPVVGELPVTEVLRSLLFPFMGFWGQATREVW